MLMPFTFSSLIRNSLTTARNSASFQTWHATETWQPGDFAVFNTSYLLRNGLKVPTIKSSKCLAVRVTNAGNFGVAPYVVADQNFISEFKRIAHQQTVSATLVSGILQTELDSLGDLVFALVGEVTVDDSSIIVKGLQGIERAVWSPAAPHLLAINGSEIVVRSPFNPESLWDELQTATACTDNPLSTKDHLLNFKRILHSLQKKGENRLVVASRHSSPPENNFLIQVINVLKDQLADYRTAVQANEETEILRIAYNFTADVLGLLRLIVSVCDLKPVIQWATLHAHLALWEALQALPWLHADHKPSVEDYIRAVHDARNQAFHASLPFNRTISVRMPGTSLTGATVRFLKEFGDNKDSPLVFDDFELVRAMNMLTRSHRTEIPNAFWHHNEGVLEALILVLTSTEVALRRARREMATQ